MKKLIALLSLLCLAINLMAQPDADDIIISTKPAKTKYIQYQIDTNNLYYYYYHDTLYNEIRITASIFDVATNFKEGLAMVKKEGKYGYIDSTGSITIPCVFDNASAFSNNVAIVFADCKTGIIDKAGNLTLIKEDYEHVFPFSEERAIVISKNQYGVINKQGIAVVATQYANMRSYSYNRAVFEDTITHLCGAIDTLGNVVIKPTYNMLHNFDMYGLATAEQNIYNKKKPETIMGIIDNKGTVIVPVEFKNVNIVNRENDIYSLPSKDPNANFFIVAYNFKNNYKKRKRFFSKFIYAISFKLNRRKKSKKGIDKALKKLQVNNLYDRYGKLLHTDKKNLILVMDNTHAMTVNKNQITTINLNGTTKQLNGITLATTRELNENKLLLIENKKQLLGLMDIDGNIKIAPNYTRIARSRSNVLLNDKQQQQYTAFKNDTVTIFDDNFNAVLKINADAITKELYSDENSGNNLLFNFIKKPKVFYIIEKDKKFGILDSTYKQILPTIYDNIKYEDGIMLFKLNGKYGIMNTNFTIIKQPVFDKLTPAYNHDYIPVNKLIFTQNKKQGVCNINGDVEIEAKYDKLYSKQIRYYDSSADTTIYTNYYIAINNKKTGVLNSVGQELIPLTYNNINTKENDYLIVTKNKKQALYKYSGQAITGFNYSRITDLYNTSKYLQVEIKKLRGVIDTAGKTIIPVQYDNTYALRNNGYFELYSKKLQGIADSLHNIIIPVKYNSIEYSEIDKNYTVSLNKKWGVLNAKGTTVLPLEYSGIVSWNEGFCRVMKDAPGKTLYGVANTKGKIIIEPSYAHNEIDYYRNTIILTVGNQRFFYNADGEPVNDCYIDKHIGN